MRIANDRKTTMPSGEYTATMKRSIEGRIYSERGMRGSEAIKYAKEAIALGWEVEVVGPDNRIYFIGGPSNA